jgi:hypothetical protein
MNCRTKSSIFCSVFLLLAFLLSSVSHAADTVETVESETGFYYTIQKGDTLWGLSQQFSDSPWLWPELWEENDQISNPHWIFPGERIRLYKKKGAQTITKAAPSSSQPVVIPPAPVKPVSKKAKKKRNKPFFFYPSIDRIGFIRKPPVSPSGTIFEVQGRKDMISEGDIVYIRPSEDAPVNLLIPGSRHTIFRYLQPTDEKDSTETIGTQHYILGIVELTQKEPDMILAKVVKSFRPIKVNDMLMPYYQQSPKIELKPSTPGIDGRIIISEDHTVLTGDYMLAFIDKGKADNIEAGQQYSIYTQQKTVLENSQIKDKLFPPNDFGTLLVLHTEHTTSTVVITQTSHNIDPGERFRTPVN